MTSSQMEKYVWSSVLYYIAAVAASLIIFFYVETLGRLLGFVVLLGYIILIILLNAWRRRRHPRSAYQVKLAQRELND
ncbi:hypothetical protein FJW08_13555 [Mesorhizobium sp. B3-2-1]|nr:hypothetical protein FJW08_13555 [Mesorhizobium sp. B3-2-1]